MTIAKWPTAAGALVAAWVVPLATHLAGADALLLPLVVVGLMSVQRGGRGFVDRLVLAVVQLFGTLCVAGLLISVWPWHLHPVPIAGCALSALVLVAVVTGRRPQLRGTFGPADRLLTVVTLAVAMLAVEPFALRDLGGRIGLIAPGEDIARHFLVFDEIGRIGGYAFLHPAQAAAYVPDSLGTGLRNYPQGTHFLYAVLDRFLRSSSTNTNGVTEMDVLIWLCVATFVFAAFALLWAVRRVAGPGPGWLRLLPVLGIAALVTYFGDPVAILTRGYPNELVGLALVAVLSAIAARPLTRAADQIVTMLALVVGISFSYHLFLPYAAVVVAAWAWRDRGALRRRPWLLGAGVLVAPAVAVTPLLNLHAANGRQLTLAGTALTTDRPVTVAVAAVAVFGVLARQGLRSPARRMVGVELGTVLVLVGALLAYQYATVGRPIYYFEKTLHLLIVVALVGLGASARLVPGVLRPSPTVRGRLRAFVPATVAVTIAAVALAGAGGAWHTTPGSTGFRLASGLEKGSPQGGRDAILITRAFPDGGGKANVDLMHTPYANFFGTLFGSVMQRDYRHGHDWHLMLHPELAHTRADLESLVLDSDVPVRFFVQNPQASFLVVDPEHPDRQRPGPGVDPAAYGDRDAPTNLAIVRDLQARYPERVEVIVVPAQEGG